MKKLKKPTVGMLIATLVFSNIQLELIYGYKLDNNKQNTIVQNQEKNTDNKNEINDISVVVSTENELNDALVDPNIKYIELKNDIKNKFPYDDIKGDKVIEGNGYKIDATECYYGRVLGYDRFNNNTLELNNISIDYDHPDGYWGVAIIRYPKYLKINNSVISNNADESPIIDCDGNSVEIHDTIINTKGQVVNLAGSLIAKNVTINADINQNSNYQQYIFDSGSGNINISDITLNGYGKLVSMYQGNVVANNITVDEYYNEYPAFEISAGSILKLQGYYSGNKYMATKDLSRTDQEGIIKDNIEIKGKLIEYKHDTKIDYYISNEKPVINASDVEIKVGDTFNALSVVNASDKEDGNITSKILVKENTVDTTKEGIYKVVYTVTDSDKNTVTKEIKVTVKSNEKPVDLIDIKGHWAELSIRDFINNGYINGYDDKTFRPNNSITRAEFIKIFNKYFELDNKSGKTFNDTSTHWAKDEIDIAVTHGVINGYPDKTFRPNEPITREEAAKVISNYKKIEDNNLDKLNKYKDATNVSNWAADSVEGVLEQGYMNGYSDKTFRPKNNITRAEAVVTLSRIKK